jgi:nucleolar protein 53
LFIIEKTGNNDILNKKSNEFDSKIKTKISNKSKLNEIKSNLKYLKSLESQSKVEPIIARTGPKDRKRTFLNDDKKFWKQWPQKEKQLLKAKQNLIEKQEIKCDPKLRFKVYDIWDEKEESDGNDSDLKELIDYQLILKGSKPPKIPQHRFQKPSLLPAIEVPHLGQSYNPSFEDHQKLLSTAHNIEVEKIKKENRLKRIVENNYVTKAEAPNDRTWVQEMSHGLGLSDDEEGNDKQEEDIDNSEGLQFTKDIRRENKKSKAKRRRELLEKQKMANKKLSKNLKSKANEIFKLRNIKKEIEKKEKESVEKQKRRSQRIIEKMYKPNKLSQYSYEAPDIELNFTEELTGSLRTIKTDGNLLEDRFKSLQRRNLIETRTKQSFKRKYKLKQIPKKSCKQSL